MKRRFIPILVTIAMGIAIPVLAETPKPFPDFTFKRVKAPSKTAKKRIMVQIDPSATTATIAAAPASARDVPEAAPVLSALDWYWKGVSPKLSDSGPGRLAGAVSYLTNAPGNKNVPTPRLQDMQNIAKQHGLAILKATIGTDVSPALVLAVIGIESAGRADALSTAGARGVMQLMPATAERFGVKDVSIAAENIRGGVAYLDWLMKEFENDPVMVLASYNAGENAVKRHEGVPPYAETRAYIPKVLAAWTVARGLCLTPPELVTDGCVFAVQGVRTNG